MSVSDDLDPVALPGPPEPPAFIADGLERKPDPRSITVDRLTGGITLAIFGAVTLVGLLIFAVFGPLNRIGILLVFAGWLSLGGLFTALVLLWPPLSHRHTFYRVTADGIRIRRGVLWRASISVPRSRIQHTDVSQGPVDRAFDLATLIIYTAGTQHASVSLSGLENGTALAIRDHLIVSGAGDGV